jgi:hypothetical protein
MHEMRTELNLQYGVEWKTRCAETCQNCTILPFVESTLQQEHIQLLPKVKVC